MKIAVLSSNIRTIEYDPIKKLLEVEFKSGTVYYYDEVPVDIWNSFRASQSKGKFLTASIKPYFKCRKKDAFFK